MTYELSSTPSRGTRKNCTKWKVFIYGGEDKKAINKRKGLFQMRLFASEKDEVPYPADSVVFP